MKLEIPQEYQSIGLMFSGGMDSTLLLYHLGRQYADRDIYAVTAGSCGYVSYPVHIEFAQQAFNRVSQNLGYGAVKYHVIHYLDDRESHHCNEVMKAWDHIDCWVVGQNSSPPPGSVVVDPYNKHHDLYETCPMPHRKNTEGDVWTEQHGRPVYRPMMHMNKRDIVQDYRDNQIYHLIQHTRSCPKVWSPAEAADFVPHCGYCWWCLERKWGLQDENEIRT